MEIILIGVGLGMDAFAVAVCKGLSMKKMSWRKAIIIGFYFGAFQALMPVIGYFLGDRFEEVISSFDHWIAFLLLSAIGLKMIIESLRVKKEESNEQVDFKTMLPLALATSIDALAVGITFVFLKIDILLAMIVIGVTTFLLSLSGVKIGNTFGDRHRKKAEIFGGIVLILIGFKILVEHLR